MKKQKNEALEKQRKRYQLNVKLDPEKDKQLINIVESQKNKQGFIKRLILEYETDMM